MHGGFHYNVIMLGVYFRQYFTFSHRKNTFKRAEGHLMLSGRTRYLKGRVMCTPQRFKID